MVAKLHYNVTLTQIKISEYEKLNQHYAQQNIALLQTP